MWSIWWRIVRKPISDWPTNGTTTRWTERQEASNFFTRKPCFGDIMIGLGCVYIFVMTTFESVSLVNNIDTCMWKSLIYIISPNSFENKLSFLLQGNPLPLMALGQSGDNLRTTQPPANEYFFLSIPPSPGPMMFRRSVGDSARVSVPNNTCRSIHLFINLNRNEKVLFSLQHLPYYIFELSFFNKFFTSERGILR